MLKVSFLSLFLILCSCKQYKPEYKTTAELGYVTGYGYGSDGLKTITISTSRIRHRYIPPKTYHYFGSYVLSDNIIGKEIVYISKTCYSFCRNAEGPSILKIKEM